MLSQPILGSVSFLRGYTLPTDSLQLRDDLLDCLPSLVLDRPLAVSGQRVVYLGHFKDSLIPKDVLPPSGDDPDEKPFLHGWEDWGQIVVKVVQDADRENIVRLQAEADILTELRPINFPRLLFSNLFTENPVTEEDLFARLYVTIEEFIDGNPLNEISKDFIGNEKRTAQTALGIANALLPLWNHPKRFVHRDIKPANVLIRRNGEVVVIDLGIVRETGSPGVTRAGFAQAPHTAGYAAPEQIANEKLLICFKTDFFSIGVLMYFLFSGLKPFEPKPNMDHYEILIATRNIVPNSLNRISSSSDRFSEFVDKALQKEQFKRHRTPAIFIDELNSICG